MITGVADRALGQIARVVYLDAFVPEDGQGVLDLIAPKRRQITGTPLARPVVVSQPCADLLLRAARPDVCAPVKPAELQEG